MSRLNIPTPDATTTATGKIELAGDISGTATSPTVPELVARRYGSLNVIAHSYTAGTTQTDSGVANVYQESLVAKLQSLLGIHEQNVNHFGQAASHFVNPTNVFTASSFGGWSGALQFIVPNNSTNINAAADIIVTDPPVAAVGLNLIVHGVNDYLADWTSASPVNAAQPAYIALAYGHALRSTIARMRMGVLHDASTVAGVITWDSALSFAGGTWANVASVLQNSGSAYKESSTNNDTVVYTIPTNFTGGYVDLGFIGQLNKLTTVTEDLDNSEVGVDVASRTGFPQGTTDFVVIVDSEQMLVTSGNGTGAGTFTVTRGFNGTSAATHTNGAVITMAQNHLVTFTTNGSNATITGTQKLGGQGAEGVPIAITKRFLCTSADAGKTITMTFSGIPAGDAYSKFWFDSTGIEAPDPPTVVVTNLHHWEYGVTLSSTVSLISAFNTNMSNVVAEFDGFVKLADVYTPFYNRNGTITSSINNTDVTTVVGWTCNSTSFTPTAGMMFTFGRYLGEHALCTAVSGSAPNWTLTLTRGQQGTSKGAYSSGNFLAPLAWMSSLDDVHLSSSGHAVYAQTILNSLKSVTTNTTYQQALNAGNWSQNSQSAKAGIIDGNWSTPVMSSGSSATPVLNRQTAIPVDIDRTSVLVGMSTIAVASSSGTIRYGLYLPDNTGTRPGRLIQDFGAYSYVSTTAWSTTGFHQILRPGRYWLSAAVQATAVSMRCVGPGALISPYLSSATAPTGAPPYGLAGYGQSGISGALADWASYTELAGGTSASAASLIIGYQLRAINRA